MSNPFIQFEIKAARLAPTLASALSLQLREAMGGLGLMWLHAYTERTDIVTPFHLRAFFGVDPELALEGLVHLGFVERVDAKQIRIRGAGRYTRLSEVRKESGRKGGLAKAALAKASAKQTDEEASKPLASAKQVPSKPRQKLALEKREESSSPTGKKNSLHEDQRDAPAAAPSPCRGSGTGDGEGAVSARPAKAPKPQRPPPPAEGTEERKFALAMGDYETLHWGPYAKRPGEVYLGEEVHS